MYRTLRGDQVRSVINMMNEIGPGTAVPQLISDERGPAKVLFKILNIVSLVMECP